MAKKLKARDCFSRLSLVRINVYKERQKTLDALWIAKNKKIKKSRF